VECAIKLGLALGSHCAAQHLRAQELLLPRPAQGLPDQPVRDPGGAGRRGVLLGDEKKTVRLVRAHLEEDAGKSLHEDFTASPAST
jgi:aspartyl-tRNA(Asn)/glutamyl-tRNA(Gln) amidotransferase subunit B